MKYFLASLALAVGLSSLALYGADEKVVSPAKPGEQPAVVATAFKASTLIGMTVKNTKDEKVGTISDFVVDAPTGRIRYAAVSVGGFLGIGDKLFAIPWKAMLLKHESNGACFVLDVNKDRLRNAPGFSKDHWPDFGDPKYGIELDQYYGVDADQRAEVSPRVK